MAWIKTPIITAQRQRAYAWAIPYRGLLLTRAPKRGAGYTLTVPGTGKCLPYTFFDVMNAKCYVDCLHEVASDVGGLDLTLPPTEIVKRYSAVVREAWEGFGFCWPELEDKRAKVEAEKRARKASFPPSGREGDTHA